MTRVFGRRRSLMPNDEDVDSPFKCRERRRRRIELRRRLGSVRAIAGADHCEAQKLAAEMENENTETSPAPPVYGLMSVVGRAREMEDEISVRTNLCRPEINGYRPVHFFGVFDGHGGHHVSALCKENMHVIMEEELMRIKPTGDRSTEGELAELWRTAIDRSFLRMDEMAKTLCLCNGLENLQVCGFHPQLSLVGSTAVVSLLTQEYIIIANCGDSRAVLCRNGKAVPLSVDHKPKLEVEGARIDGCGGRILFAANGAGVEGVVAIGGRVVKQVVRWEPEYSFTKRKAGDMSLILGSDGLWGVLSTELTCQLVHKCQQEDEDEDMAFGGGSRNATATATAAAAFLVRLALGRRSTDNISVIVVDLRN